MIFVMTLGAGSLAWARSPELGHSPLQRFDVLLGQWQCQAQQVHIGLDHFDLEYIDAQVGLQVIREVGTHNLCTAMQATSLTSESLFQTKALISYDPQRSLFVQYESTRGGSDATLYSAGFVGPCVTWRYASETGALKMLPPTGGSDITIEATYCLAETDGHLQIDYTLHLAEHAPFTLFTASCDKVPEGA